ncbi:Methyltransferase domain-containing protein [Marivirga sericea]|uniref:Methyltransferase domain-containing protein n=1 Tax=Marivirga sericea TaxID=1028 RepID=A0A1X7J2D3_9BACT|nr:class I SAM-dependent methyltransferase [Marivirga sericea]SMG20956.1 Methyltransferase domain-containing protein [Marivirga sericea]
MDWKELNSELGNIDLYWLDFILKGHLPKDAKILDAGCGEGRNLTYCFKNGMDVFGVDQNPEAIQFLKYFSKQYGVQDREARFQVMKLDKILFPSETFDVIICSAVLHFAKSKEYFREMIKELVRLLKPNGKMFIRTMTDRYMAEGTIKIDQNIYQLSDHQVRFAMNGEIFVKDLSTLKLELIEPFKEIVVNGRYSMGTFMLQKH